LLDVLVENRIIFVSGAAIVLVIGLVIAALTGHWWIAGVAAAVDLAGTLIVAATIFSLTSDTEHPSPSLAVEMENEGDPDPDRTFTKLVDEFGGPRQDPGEPRRDPN